MVVEVQGFLSVNCEGTGFSFVDGGGPGFLTICAGGPGFPPIYGGGPGCSFHYYWMDGQGFLFMMEAQGFLPGGPGSSSF